MENNINFTFIKEYSNKLSSIVCDRYFSNNTYITGKAILELTSFKQLNLFIIKSLFDQWQIETENLKSPYFDYEAPDVQSALKKFMNVLSNYMRVTQSDFKPLVSQACIKTIILTISPYEFFSSEINRKKRLSIHDLNALKKYIKVNKDLLDAYILRFEEDKIEEIFSEDAFRIFNEVCERTNELPEDFEPYIEQLNSILGLNVDSIFSADDKSPKINLYEAVEEKAIHSVNEQYSEHKTNLAEIHAKKPIEGIRKSISINQRFMFVKELFNDDIDEFEEAVNKLDSCNKRDEAIKLLEENYIFKNEWDMEAEEVKEFYDIIDKRFLN